MKKEWKKNEKAILIFFAFFGILICMFLVKSKRVSAQNISAQTHFLEFTAEEKEYLIQKKTIKAAILDEWYPISKKDSKTNTYQGLPVDILTYLEEKTGVAIEYVTVGTYKEAMKMTEEGKVDIIVSVVNNSYSENLYTVALTEPYLKAQMVMIHDKKTDFSQLSQYELAEVDGYPIFTKNSQIFHMNFDTVEECLLAVRSGQANIMYCDIFSARAYLQRYRNRDLVSIPINTEMQFCFGITEQEAPMLKGILNRLIASMSRKEINDSLMKNRKNITYTLEDFVYHNPFEILCISLTIVFLLLIIYVEYLRIKSRQNIAVHGYEKSYAMLADTFGEAGFRYDYLEDRMTLFGHRADQLAVPLEIQNFHDYLQKEEKEVSLTKEQFQQMLQDGLDEKATYMEMMCLLKNGSWQHFQIIFSIITTDTSYRRPVALVGYLKNIEHEYQEKEKLIQMGMYDQLTKILNRAGGQAEVEKYFAKETERTKDIVMLIDIDFFKNFNDSFGHLYGDEVLAYLGEQLRNIFYDNSIVFRWGGDEFCLYLIGGAKNMKEVRHLCEELKKVMRKFRYQQKVFPVTLSIGGAVMGTKTFEETFKKADEALYQVKNLGRNAACILEDENR